MWNILFEDRWIWPAVWWMDEGSSFCGCLVFRGASDMFWSSCDLVAAQERATYPAFWRDASELRITNAWTGHVAEHTFAAGYVHRLTPPIRQLSMRSLWPPDAPRRAASHSRLRTARRERITAELGDERCEALRSWVATEVGRSPWW